MITFLLILAVIYVAGFCATFSIAMYLFSRDIFASWKDRVFTALILSLGWPYWAWKILREG